MRYAIFSALYPPHLGGVERYSQNLARHLVERGDEAVVITSALDPHSVGCEVDEVGVTVVRLPAVMAMAGRLPLVAPSERWRRLLGQVAAIGPDRVVVNTRFYPLSLAGIAFGKSQALPTLVIDHGQGFLTLENPVADGVIAAYERVVTGVQRRWHPRYAGVSCKSAQWLATLGIKTHLVVPNAIDALAFRAKATDRDFRAELGLGAREPLAVFAGRLYESKGAQMVAHAARFLPKVSFVVAGEGPLARAIAASDRPNLYLVGALRHGDLSRLFSQADVLCLPSVREGFATTLLEAGAWGLPPVTTPVGGADEVLADPNWGVLLDRRTPLALAMGVEEVLGWSAQESRDRSQALAHHVASACTWASTLHGLDQAFEDCSG